MNLIKKKRTAPKEDFFSDVFENDYFSPRFLSNYPAVNIIETNKEYLIELAAPGLKKDDFKITIDNGILIISTGKEDLQNRKSKYTHHEFNYGSFTRSFILPQRINESGIDGKYEDGILKIILPVRKKNVSAAIHRKYERRS